MQKLFRSHKYTLNLFIVGSGQQGDYEGAFTLSPEVYGDEDDYIANYEDAKPSTTDELLAERDVLYGKGKFSKF